MLFHNILRMQRIVREVACNHYNFKLIIAILSFAMKYSKVMTCVQQIIIYMVVEKETGNKIVL